MTMEAIKESVEAKQVKLLFHFTRSENLATIIKFGLHPVAQIHKIGVEPAINDQLRLDGRTDSTSLSIGFPNSSMFFRYRKECDGVDWTVLGVHPAVLWTKDCAFCQRNAADRRVSNTPIANLKSSQAFLQMYEEMDDLKSRSEQKLKISDPTDVQAEVLVFGVIEPKYIIGAFFNSQTSQDKYSAVLEGRQSLVHRRNKGVFSARSYARSAW